MDFRASRSAASLFIYPWGRRRSFTHYLSGRTGTSLVDREHFSRSAATLLRGRKPVWRVGSGWVRHLIPASKQPQKTVFKGYTLASLPSLLISLCLCPKRPRKRSLNPPPRSPRNP